MSLCAADGEWRTRKINLFAVIKGFVSQIKVGADLTKVSLPAEICFPYTMLEVIGYRELVMFHSLAKANDYSDPLERFMMVIRFFLATIKQETFEKKPLNAVLGENHICWAVHDENGDDVSAFIGEQVSHHPPISAYQVTNRKHELGMTANISFGVKFGSNQVSVTTSGAETITLGKFGEEYELSKCLPDMIVRNVVIGKKYIMWEGEVTVQCPANGLVATLKFAEKSKDNVVTGKVMNIETDEVVYEIKGVCGKEIHFFAPGKQADQKLLIDVVKEPMADVQYLPQEHLDGLSSVWVWRKVYAAMVQHDIPLADKEKKIVEQEQRERSKDRQEKGLMNTAMYFDKNEEGTWVFRGKHSVDKYLDDPDNYLWSRSSGPGVYQPNFGNSTPLVNVVGADAPAATSESAASTSTSGSSTDAMLKKKDKGKEREKPAQAKDDSSVVDSLALPAPDVAPQSHSDSEAPNVVSDDDTEHKVIISPRKKDVVAVDLVRRESSQDASAIQSASANSSAAGSRRPRLSVGASSSPALALVAQNNGPVVSPKPSSKELKIEKKKEREEQKALLQKAKIEKKKNSEILSQSQALPTLKTGFVKMRNSLKKWQSRWLVLQPDQSDAQRDSCSGILNLAGCEARPRPSKKDGFCFKIFNLAQYPIYSKQGLKGETLRKALLPVGDDYCIMRVTDEKERSDWIDKIHQAIPEYERIKALGGTSFVDYDSDSDDDDDGDDASTVHASGEPADVASPKDQSIASSARPMSDGEEEDAKAPQWQTRDVIEQIGRLHKMTRKVAAAQKKLQEQLEEVKKASVDKMTTTEKTLLFQIKSANQQRAAQLKQQEEEKQAKGYIQKLKEAKNDPIAVINMVVILLMMWFIMFSR